MLQLEIILKLCTFRRVIWNDFIKVIKHLGS